MKKKNKIIFISTLFISFLGYYFLNSKYHIAIPCIFHDVTGFYCPGCGITRMLFSLIQLDIYQAFRYNPFVFCLCILFILYKVIYWLVNKIWSYKIKINSKIYIVLLLLTIGFGFLRNIPFFEYLKPTLIK